MIQILGIIAGTLFITLMAGIAIGRTLFGDRAYDPGDEQSNALFIGGGADNFQHERGTSRRERNDHA